MAASIAFCSSSLFFSRYRSVKKMASNKDTHSVIDIRWFGEFEGVVLSAPFLSILWILLVYRVYPDCQRLHLSGM